METWLPELETNSVVVVVAVHDGARYVTVICKVPFLFLWASERAAWMKEGVFNGRKGRQAPFSLAFEAPTLNAAAESRGSLPISSSRAKLQRRVKYPLARYRQ
jgi:hypothetical protein